MQAYLEQWGVRGREVRPLEGGRYTIGRHPSNDLAVEADSEVSRVHAALEIVGPSWVVRDLSSRNGTRVNGSLISGERPLADGDEVRVGATRLVFRTFDQSPQEPTKGAEPPPTLTARERDVLLELLRPSAVPGPFNQPASTRDIARALVVSEAAVKQHLSNLYDKFGLHAGLDDRRLRLANEALARGAVSLAELRAKGPSDPVGQARKHLPRGG